MADSFDSWLVDRRNDEPEDDRGLAPGTRIGEFSIQTLLGRGGFAEVYRATDVDGSPVAVKLLHRLDEKSRFRFEREARILSQVRHPNFPRLLGFGSYGVRPYVVTELLRAAELPHKDHKVAAFLYRVISAVEELHRHGFVHRDLKPSNVLARDNGEPVVIDFGLASPISRTQRDREALSVEGSAPVAVGTIGYSAPEQFSGLAAGPEADVHALGVLINECFDGKMPRCWQKIYLRATNSNPRMRYNSVGRLRRAIRRRHLIKLVSTLVILGVVGAATYLGISLTHTTEEGSSEPIVNILPREPV